MTTLSPKKGAIPRVLVCHSSGLFVAAVSFYLLLSRSSEVQFYKCVMMEDRKCELPRLVKFCVKRELQSLQLLISPKLNYYGLNISSSTHLCS